MREDMFDRWADLRLLAMDARDEAALCQHLLVLLRSISGVCPNGVCGVPLIQHIDETRAVESRSIARRPFAYQSMMTINRDMVLVAECWNGKIDLWHATLFRLGLGVFDRPACIAILLAQLRGLVLPAVWNAALLDRVLLFARIALLGRGDDGGVYDLSTHGKIA